MTTSAIHPNQVLIVLSSFDTLDYLLQSNHTIQKVETEDRKDPVTL